MSDTVRINFVGDVALFRQFERDLIDPLKDISLPDADYNVANFEFPVPDSAQKHFYDASDEYLVSHKYAKNLKLSKFDLYGLANNHVFDYGECGILETVGLLKEQGSNVFGVSTDNDYAVHVSTINDIVFAFIAAVKPGRWGQKEDVFGPNIIDFYSLNAKVSELEKASDHVIVYLHWGSELIDAPIPADVDEAERLIDSGASCVVGHHPHVAQGVASYGGGLVAYSLGSFIYLSEYEKGNRDNQSIRDLSICLNVEFNKDSIVGFVPYKYQRSREQYIPESYGDFRDDPYFEKLNEVLGDDKYYTIQLRKILLKREFYSFVERFKKNPIKATCHYFSYVRLSHIKKLLGVSA